METSLLIGKHIEYSQKSHNSSILRTGMVTDKVAMLEDRKGVMHVVTGYMVKDDSGNLDTIAYWRVKRELA